MFRRHRALPFLLLFLFVLLAYSPSLKGSFVYDDYTTIFKNNFIKNPKNLRHLFDRSYFSGSKERSYRPVATLMNFLDYWLYRDNARGYHFTNILLHFFNAFLLFHILLRLGASDTTAFVVSSLFSVHPAFSEAVFNISYREDLLCFVFLQAAFLFFLLFARRENHFFLLCALLLYSLSLLSKETAIMLPFFLVLFSKTKKQLKQSLLFTLPPLSGYLLVRFLLMPGMDKSSILFFKPRLLFVAAQLPTVFFSYVRDLLFPLHLSPDYLLSASSPTVFGKAVFSLLGHAFLIQFFFLRRKESPMSYFGILWFYLFLLPASGVWPLAHLKAGRYLYLPAAGFLLALWIEIGKLKWKNLSFLAVLFPLFLLSYSWRTYRYGSVWQDNFSLWTYVLKENPKSYRAYNTLGSLKMYRGSYKEALAYFQKALSLYREQARQGNYLLSYNIALAFKFLGKQKESVTYLKQSIREQPRYAPAWKLLGAAHAERKEWLKAQQFLKDSLRIDPFDVEGWLWLGHVYRLQGKVSKALQAYHRAIRLRPDLIPAYINLILLYQRLGNQEKASLYREKGLSSTAHPEKFRQILKQLSTSE